MNLKSKLLTAIVVMVYLLLFVTQTGTTKALWPLALSRNNSPPVASFEWSMPQRFGPLDPHGLVDYHWDRATRTYDPKFINPRNWTVNFNACRNNGPNIRSYQWEILSERILRTDCTLSYDKFKFQGTYPIKLTVIAIDGQTSSIEQVIGVKDLLIVSIGDSFAAGQGNPDIYRDEDKHIKAQWIYSRCHRSATAAAALAARR